LHELVRVDVKSQLSIVNRQVDDMEEITHRMWGLVHQNGIGYVIVNLASKKFWQFF
jgi:hypothetical protein